MSAFEPSPVTRSLSHPAKGRGDCSRERGQKVIGRVRCFRSVCISSVRVGTPAGWLRCAPGGPHPSPLPEGEGNLHVFSNHRRVFGGACDCG